MATTCEPNGAAWPAARLGFAVGLSPGASFRFVGPEPALGDERIAFGLATGATFTPLDLLLVPSDSSSKRPRGASAGAACTGIALGDVAAGDSVQVAHLLRVWPPTIDDAGTAEALAADYQQPAAILPSAGTVVHGAAGDLNHDGFNEARGCYELAAAGHELRFLFDPGRWVRPSPIIHVARTPRLAVAEVRIDGLAQANLPMERDAGGDLVLMLPTLSGRPAACEIDFAPRR
jgi:hypothetical protein